MGEERDRAAEAAEAISRAFRGPVVITVVTGIILIAIAVPGGIYGATFLVSCIREGGPFELLAIPTAFGVAGSCLVPLIVSISSFCLAASLSRARASLKQASARIAHDATAQVDAEEQLARLKRMFESGKIEKEEYERRRLRILDQM